MFPFVLANEGHYRNAFKYYKNLKKDKRWTSYVPNGAQSMTMSGAPAVRGMRMGALPEQNVGERLPRLTLVCGGFC